MICGWPADGPPNGPPFRAGRSASSKLDSPHLVVLYPLYLAMINPHMYYMSSLFYHSFAMLNHTSHTICIPCQSFMAYLFIMHHCTRVEIVTPEQEELELQIVGDSTPVETQGRPLSISYTLFWINEVYVSCLSMSYYIYMSLIA